MVFYPFCDIGSLYNILIHAVAFINLETYLHVALNFNKQFKST